MPKPNVSLSTVPPSAFQPGREGRIQEMRLATAPTRVEKQMAIATREDMVAIEGTRIKTEFAVNRLEDLNVHAYHIFERGSGQILAGRAGPKVDAEHVEYCAQFAHICVQSLSRHIQGAVDLGAGLIGDEVARSIRPDEGGPRLFGRLVRG